MKPILSIMYTVLSLGIASLSGFSIWAVSWIGMDISYLLSSVYALAGAAVVFTGLKVVGRHKMLKNIGMSGREYKFVKENLIEGKEKIKRLQKSMFSFKDLLASKQNYEVLRKVKRIDSLVRNEPKRFYQAESFYFYHLNSLVELTEKHAFLNKQPHRTVDLVISLNETRDAIKLLEKQIDSDLGILLEGDIQTLHMELDMAKQTLNKKPLIK
ncbi:5-bromo-4-chloroindolyl phosphate hydrolysis family protein [Peribacillus psychrosaccharolyticus]|uniref:5-bromo-4-chloroindolyl phosphate hydrolysis family protein n=1 Tax=Peribacillus psychrosaccharolyticus TaxID=1407 RepID=A0A974NL89_PERPY|nr:5-bromo-4-chloroindolyl phosphate hydrolysis family protein [Peribacillus psychrosaccharolyticus]MEC2054466.1 5-bromo-4-chloroindolyl phosphate hydrolysis family protein [Peribacillus psychrosaccharolyticus]MED3744307.1 5-bromo-4-chloroindolyl phosphate hydrolysis family protein [Peribacillus psychrosaccharolyticus]QQS99788.1 5-bromo-4-chloroindolyl phosphate hydrolysis family protein [Peribacillus psychrosaccharolyticus]